MAIRDRVDESIFLLQHKRYEGALLQMLIAVAAASALKHPRSMGDKKRFETYVRAGLCAGAAGISFPGMAPDRSPIVVQVGKENLPLETILYKHFRCSLAHEGKLDDDVELSVEEGQGWSVRAGGGSEKFAISSGVIGILHRILLQDPVIAAELA